MPSCTSQWFGESRRLLGLPRVILALSIAAGVATAVLPLEIAIRVLAATAVGTYVAGEYGRSILGCVKNP